MRDKLGGLVICSVALAGCGAPAPLSLSLAQGETIRGGALTTAYTSSRSGEQAQECQASYTGASANSTALLEIRCADGRYGIGTGELRNSRLVGGIVRMQDGQEARIQANFR